MLVRTVAVRKVTQQGRASQDCGYYNFGRSESKTKKLFFLVPRRDASLSRICEYLFGRMMECGNQLS
jgi:hypothetical protein